MFTLPRAEMLVPCSSPPPVISHSQSLATVTPVALQRQGALKPANDNEPLLGRGHQPLSSTQMLALPQRERMVIIIVGSFKAGTAI